MAGRPTKYKNKIINKLTCLFNGHHKWRYNQAKTSMECEICKKHDYAPDYWDIEY